MLDASGVVMSRQSSLKLDKSLPVIVGYKQGKRKIRAGMELPKLKPCLDLIMLTHTDFPEFKIVATSLKDQDELSFVMYYKGRKGKPYKVTMPVYNLRYGLKVLKSSILKALRAGDPRRTINLMYKGRVIMSRNCLAGEGACRNC